MSELAWRVSSATAGGRTTCLYAVNPDNSLWLSDPRRGCETSSSVGFTADVGAAALLPCSVCVTKSVRRGKYSDLVGRRSLICKGV
jgi:hypothetical protein